MAYVTHNTPDCLKYDSNGTLRKSYKVRRPTGTSHGPKRPAQGGSSFAQLSAKIDKIEKSNKKMRRALLKQKERKRHKTSDTIQTHPEMMGRGILGIYVVIQTVIKK